MWHPIAVILIVIRILKYISKIHLSLKINLSEQFRLTHLDEIFRDADPAPVSIDKFN